MIDEPSSVSSFMSSDQEFFFLTSKNPFPPDDGQKIPLAKYHDALKSAGKAPEICVFSKQPPTTSTQRLGAVAKRLNPFDGFHSSEILDAETVDRIKRSPRPLVFVSPARLLGTASEIKRANPAVRIVLLLNDAKWPMYLEALQYGLGLQAGGVRDDLLKGLLTPITYLKELSAYKAADVVVLQTERERRKLPWLDKKSIAAMNAIEAPTVTWHGDESSTLTMQVNFNSRRRNKWRPFVENVWPQVRERRPDLTLELFGPGPDIPPEWVQTSPGVRFIGLVDDLDQHLARCRLLLMPLEHATGVSNMVLRGLAMDMPMVISATARIGVSELLPHYDAVFVAETETEQTEKILQALDKPHTPKPSAIGSWSENLAKILEKVTT